MQTTKEARSQAYDRLCAMAEALLKRANPCGSCKVCTYFGGRGEGCCVGCPFLGPSGCTIQCLACKLWLCDSANKVMSDVHAHQLQRLQRIADKFRFRFARATKEEALSAPKSPRNGMWYFYHKFDRGRYA